MEKKAGPNSPVWNHSLTTQLGPLCLRILISFFMGNCELILDQNKSNEEINLWQKQVSQLREKERQSDSTVLPNNDSYNSGIYRSSDRIVVRKNTNLQTCSNIFSYYMACWQGKSQASDNDSGASILWLAAPGWYPPMKAWCFQILGWYWCVKSMTQINRKKTNQMFANRLVLSALVCDLLVSSL